MQLQISRVARYLKCVARGMSKPKIEKSGWLGKRPRNAPSKSHTRDDSPVKVRTPRDYTRVPGVTKDLHGIRQQRRDGSQASDQNPFRYLTNDRPAAMEAEHYSPKMASLFQR